MSFSYVFVCVYPCTPIPHQGVAAVALQVTTCALATFVYVCVYVCVCTHTYPFRTRGLLLWLCR